MFATTTFAGIVVVVLHPSFHPAFVATSVAVIHVAVSLNSLREGVAVKWRSKHPFGSLHFAMGKARGKETSKPAESSAGVRKDDEGKKARRKLRRNASAEAVNRVIQKDFGDLNVEVTDSITVDGKTLRQTLGVILQDLKAPQRAFLCAILPICFGGISWRQRTKPLH